MYEKENQTRKNKYYPIKTLINPFIFSEYHNIGKRKPNEKKAEKREKTILLLSAIKTTDERSPNWKRIEYSEVCPRTASIVCSAYAPQTRFA
jgi:hypothetical protein